MTDGIRLAVKQDIPALCEIWEQCFSDSKDYIQLFYENNFERMKTFAFYAEGKPVSMLHLIDATIKHGDKSQAAKFIYATGTLSEHRKNGCMTALIRHVTDMADKNNFALFLKPSSDFTARFYESLGFEEGTNLNVVTLPPCEKQPLTVSNLSFHEYNRLREAAFNDIPHIKWEDAYIRWCIKENEFFSGKTIEISYDNKSYFLLGYPENGTLIINETDLSVNQLKTISGSLCRLFGTEKIIAYMPDFSCGKEGNSLSVLLYNTHIAHPYINMIMI